MSNPIQFAHILNPGSLESWIGALQTIRLHRRCHLSISWLFFNSSTYFFFMVCCQNFSPQNCNFTFTFSPDQKISAATLLMPWHSVPQGPRGGSVSENLSWGNSANSPMNWKLGEKAIPLQMPISLSSSFFILVANEKPNASFSNFFIIVGCLLLTVRKKDIGSLNPGLNCRVLSK